MGKRGNTNYEFSSSNPMWRASLELLDFLPLSTVDYSGGVIISDWYSDNSKSNSMFSTKYQFALSEMHQLGAGGLAGFEIAQEHLQLVQEMFTGQPMFRYNRHADRLYLDISWGGDADIDDFVVVEVDKILDPSTYADIWSDMFLKKYNTALMKKQWGQNLIKFEGMQLPGGVTMNGRQLYDDAKEELDQIGEEMQLRYELPVDHLIG